MSHPHPSGQPGSTPDPEDGEDHDVAGETPRPGGSPASAEPDPGGDGPDDAALLAAVARRDRDAFADLFTRYAGRIKGFLTRGGTPAAEAEEATQEIMLSIWRAADSFDPAKAAASTWIFAIARNRRVDMMRRRRPEPDPEDPHFRRDPDPSGESAAAAADRDRAVREAVAALPPDQIEAVRLAFFEGLSHAEAADALGAPLGTVKGRLRLALARLREALGPDFARELLDD